MSSQQESSPEQKPSSKEHLLSRETVSAESASPFSGLPGHLLRPSPREIGLLLRRRSPLLGEGRLPRTSPQAKKFLQRNNHLPLSAYLLRQVFLPSEGMSLPWWKPVPTAFINSNKEEKEDFRGREDIKGDNPRREGSREAARREVGSEEDSRGEAPSQENFFS